MLAPAQRPVNDEQVAISRHAVLVDRGPRLDRRRHFDLGQMTLEGLGEPDHERHVGRFACDMTCPVIACPGGDVAGMWSNGEKPFLSPGDGRIREKIRCQPAAP